MKILHFIILFISICIITSKISSLHKSPLILPKNYPQGTRKNTYGNQGSQGSVTTTTSVIPSNSGTFVLTSNYEKQYNCLKKTNNTDFNYLLNNYESKCQKNKNCSFFETELNQLAYSCEKQGSRCNCEKNKKLYQAMGCAGYIPQVFCIN